MIDHVFLTVSDLDRSIDFYTKALAPLGIVERFDYDGKNGPPGHRDLKGFGANGRFFFWLRSGTPMPAAVHVGFCGGFRSGSARGLCRRYRRWRHANPSPRSTTSLLLCCAGQRSRRLQSRVRL